MPGPLSSQINSNPFLTDLSVMWLQQPNDFMGMKLCQIVPVNLQSGKVPVFDQVDFQTRHMRKKALGDTFKRAGYNVSSVSYSCEGAGLEHPIPRALRNNQMSPIDVDRAGTKWIAQQYMLELEMQIAEKCWTSSIWTNTATPATTWDDYNASTPLVDAWGYRDTFRQRNGFYPNAFFASAQVDTKLRQHPDLAAKLKIRDATGITNAMMAELLGVKSYFVGGTVYNSAAPGAAQSNTDIWGKDACYAFIPDAPGIEQPAPCYTLAWRGSNVGGPGNEFGVATDVYYEPQTKSDIYQAEMFVDPQVLTVSLVQYISGAVA